MVTALSVHTVPVRTSANQCLLSALYQGLHQYFFEDMHSTLLRIPREDILSDLPERASILFVIEDDEHEEPQEILVHNVSLPHICEYLTDIDSTYEDERIELVITELGIRHSSSQEDGIQICHIKKVRGSNIIEYVPCTA